MDKVLFTHLENNDDIIISLSFEEGTEFGVEGFIMQRTPKDEIHFKPEERGACVEWEEYDDIIVLVDEIYLNREEIKIKTKGKVRTYQFDITNL